ncbi:hypothetical protein FRC04_002292 [Tulasnella sp. 424]|nr:hypothetical protein FRC04_002292 [Tulasnella sp. 424]KAG8977365.1 hypothetical protein FRC05_001763 [Tulasnella sp. 425]
MKAISALLSSLILASTSLVGASPIDKRVICPLYLPAPTGDPFEATALPGYYLDTAGIYATSMDFAYRRLTEIFPGKVAVLVKGQPLEAWTYSSSGPLGLWGPARTTATCPGFFYLNANQKTTLYATLTFDAAATTKWNATPGSNLIKLVSPTSSTFLACKRPATSTKAGAYVLFLITPGNVPITLDTDDGDSIAATSCVTTNIHVSD